MKIMRYIAPLLLGLIAFNETTNFLPSGAGIEVLVLRWCVSWAVYITAWIINLRLLQPKLQRSAHFGVYLVDLAALSAVAEGVAMNGYITPFRIITGAALMLICIGGLSAPALMRSWQEHRRRAAEAETALLDVQVADRRLKLDSAAMSHALDEAADLCATDADRAVDKLYELSRDLRSQLYDKR